MNEAPVAVAGQVVEDGPERIGHELLWRVRLPDGRRAAIAQLAPELADEPALRRRWVRDVERLAAAGAPALAEVLAVDAEAGWRMRVEPAGRRLDRWLGAEGARRPVDDAVEVAAAIGAAMAGVHAAGIVLRDLEPRAIVIGDDGRVTFTDVGLARLGILSTRTASTLAMESSAWAAPESVRATIVDARADVFTLGAILYRALIGAMPPASGPPVLHGALELRPLRELRAEIPEPLDQLVQRCLARSPDDRPATATDVVDALRGRGAGPLALVRVTCQACGEPMRAGTRLCLWCGKQAVQIAHGGEHAVVLEKVGESVEHTAALRGLYETFGAAVPGLNFLIGDERLYAKEERASLPRLPAPLFEELDEAGAQRLAAQVEGVKGLKVRIVDRLRLRRSRRAAGFAIPTGGAVAVAGVLGLVTGGVGLIAGLGVIVAGATGSLIGAIHRARSKRLLKPALARLRSAPAALPAADPLVARLAALIAEVKRADVRERVAEMALWLQRIVDHKAGLAGDAVEVAAATADIDAVLAPLGALVDAIAAQVRGLIQLDAELATLEEGALVRALAASEARREPASRRAELLAGLDRLRGLEDARAAALGRLLEAGRLLRRAADLVVETGAGVDEALEVLVDAPALTDGG